MAKNGNIWQTSSDLNLKCENEHKKKESIYKRLQQRWVRWVEWLGKNHRIVLLILLFLLYVSFIPFWEEIISKTLVEKFFSRFERNIILDLGFYFISGYLIINFLFAPPQRHSLFKYVLCAITLYGWYHYKFVSNKFEWESLFTIDAIDYIDIVAIYAALVLVRGIIDELIFLLEFLLKKKCVPTDGFVRDIPIKNEREDIFGRNDLACAEIDRILETDTTEEVFSYGIVSPWGMGKTSFMKLMKNRIEQHHSEECIVIDFNPWLYSNNTNIVELFFDELSNYMKPYDSRLANNFIDYSKAFSSIGTAETKIASTIIDLLGKRSTIKNKVDVIKESIKKINKKIVIFVDDIDRLEPNELMEMLKLIRNISNFPYMYFVVAYDKEYLLECLKDKMSTKASDFLEKIFNPEFYLPLCTKDILKVYIEKSVSSIISEDEKKSLREVIFRTIFNNSDIDAISTIREIKKICNSLNTSYLRLKGEVNICDLFMLELLKNKYPTIYSILENDRNLVLVERSKHYELYREPIEANFIDITSSIDLKKHIRENKNALYIKEMDIKKIENILDALFPQTIMAKEKSISDIQYFDRYFNLSLLKSDISDIEFNNVLQYNDIDKIKTKIKEWAVNNLSALLSKFDMLQSQSRDEQKKHIQILLYSISILPISIKGSNIISRMCDIITNKIIELGELSTDDKEFIKNALCENGYSRGLGEYLNSIKEKWNYPLSREELNIVRTNLFKDCVERHYDNMKFILQGFQSTTDLYLENGKIKVLYIPANNDLMKKYATSHFPDFIKHTIERKPYSDKEYRYSIGYLPLRLWESLDNYISFIRSIEVKTPIIDEYLTFVEKCKEENPSPNSISPIGFKFKYIKFGES